MTDTLPRLSSTVASFEIRCSIGQFVMDGPDDGRTPDLAAMGGKVTITPDLKKPLRIRGDTPLEDRVVGVNALVFTLDPLTGQLVHPDGTVGVELVDPDDDKLDPKGWTYTATVAPDAGNRWSVTFGGPGDGPRVVNIGALAGVEISPGQSSNVVQQVVTARDSAVQSAQTAETFASTASVSATEAQGSAKYAAEVAYGQPLEVTDATVAALLSDDATQAATLAKARFSTASPGTVSYWVAPTGADTNPGTSAAPFATLAKAVSMVPDQIRADHVYTINLTAGTWDEDLLLANHVIYGNLIIQGDASNRGAVRVRSVEVRRVFGAITVQHLTTTLKDNTGPAIRFTAAAPYMRVVNVVTEHGEGETEGGSPTGAAVIGLLADHGSSVHVERSDFSLKRYGIRSNFLSRVFSQDNTGVDNHRGLGARFGGIISTYGTQPGGATPYSVTSGGLIVHSEGHEAGPLSKISGEPGIASSLESRPGMPGRKTWLLRSDTVGVDLPNGVDPGHRLRVHFQAGNPGPVNCAVTFGYTGQAVTAGRYVERRLAGDVTLTRHTLTTMASGIVAPEGYDAEAIIQVGHTGADGSFYVDLIPPGSDGIRGSYWGVDIEMSIMNRYAAPILTRVETI